MGIYQLFQQGEFDLALEAIEKLQAQHAPHAKAYQLHAMILKRQGQHDKAIECLEQSLSLDPNSSEIHNNLANSYRHKRCLLYTSPSPRDRGRSRMPSSA